MSNVKHIIELAKGKMSLEGYDFVVSLIKYFIDKYRWPKTILDESTNNETYWTEDELLSFTQQLLIYVIEKRKLKNYLKIPEKYLEYYFKTIIVTYAAQKIKENQKRRGISYDDTKRISLELLNEYYFKKVMGKNIIWNKENVFENPVLDDSEINYLAENLPKIPITEKTKHYKPRVKTALNDLFHLINRPIAQKVIFNQVYKLFDQSSFAGHDNDQTKSEIREEIIPEAVKRIVNTIEKEDIPVFLDYFFSETKQSLSTLAEKFNLPKSTVHYKINQFRKIISENFLPENEDEGLFFLEKLHKTLDELT